MELEDILSDARPLKPARCYVYSSSPPRASTAHLSPCCKSPCMRPHPKSTPSTPCSAPSPAAATPRSPGISPSSSQVPKAAESQDKRVEGQPPQEYPQSIEPGKGSFLLYRTCCVSTLHLSTSSCLGCVMWRGEQEFLCLDFSLGFFLKAELRACKNT